MTDARRRKSRRAFAQNLASGTDRAGSNRGHATRISAGAGHSRELPDEAYSNLNSSCGHVFGATYSPLPTLPRQTAQALNVLVQDANLSESVCQAKQACAAASSPPARLASSANSCERLDPR
jgi:hypothetical protein